LLDTGGEMEGGSERQREREGGGCEEREREREEGADGKRGDRSREKIHKTRRDRIMREREKSSPRLGNGGVVKERKMKTDGFKWRDR